MLNWQSQASLDCSPLIDKVNKPELSHIGVFIFDCVTLENMVFCCDAIIFGNVFHNAFLHLVGPTGLEPVTPCL